MPFWRRDRAQDESGDASAQASLDAIRGAIGELTARREQARYSAAAALVNQAAVQQALHGQYRELDRARAQLASAIELAQRVADETARDDGELAADPFRQNVEGLRFQAEVIEAAVAQLGGLNASSESQVGAAREILIRSRAMFDEALHEQLRLLVTLERLERARLVLRARAAAREALGGTHPELGSGHG